MLLGLDEGIDDLINARDPCAGHDYIESVLDDLGIADVLIEQPFLLFVLIRDSFQPDVQDLYGVHELMVLGIFLVVFSIIKIVVLVLLDELLLESLHSLFETLVFFISLCLQSKNSIVGLVSRSSL